MVCSRHPGRNPKLENTTLAHPSFKPLTEHHAFFLLHKEIAHVQVPDYLAGDDDWNSVAREIFGQLRVTSETEHANPLGLFLKVLNRNAESQSGAGGLGHIFRYHSIQQFNGIVFGESSCERQFMVPLNRHTHRLIWQWVLCIWFG